MKFETKKLRSLYIREYICSNLEEQDLNKFMLTNKANNKVVRELVKITSKLKGELYIFNKSVGSNPIKSYKECIKVTVSFKTNLVNQMLESYKEIGNYYLIESVVKEIPILLLIKLLEFLIQKDDDISIKFFHFIISYNKDFSNSSVIDKIKELIPYKENRVIKILKNRSAFLDDNEELEDFVKTVLESGMYKYIEDINESDLESSTRVLFCIKEFITHGYKDKAKELLRSTKLNNKIKEELSHLNPEDKKNIKAFYQEQCIDLPIDSLEATGQNDVNKSEYLYD